MMRVIKDNSHAFENCENVTIELANGDLITIWDGQIHITISINPNSNISITPLQGNAIKIKGEPK